jgi:hypothetical protein
MVCVNQWRDRSRDQATQMTHLERNRSLDQTYHGFPSLDGLQVPNRADIGAHVEPVHLPR